MLKRGHRRKIRFGKICIKRIYRHMGHKVCYGILTWLLVTVCWLLCGMYNCYAAEVQRLILFRNGPWYAAMFVTNYWTVKLSARSHTIFACSKNKTMIFVYIFQCSPATSLLHLGLTEAMGSLMSSCENDHIQEAVTECLLSLLQIPTTKNRYESIVVGSWLKHNTITCFCFSFIEVGWYHWNIF